MNKQIANYKLQITSIVVVTIMGLLTMSVLLFGVPTNIVTAEAKYGGMSMIVMETSSNRILYQSNAHISRPIASTTKILTAITVIENADLNKQIKVDPKAVGVEGSSIYLQNGEVATIRDLLYGLMLQSGNDCAVALAIAVSGDVPSFAKLMNATAYKAGAKNANFVNPHGLHDDNHLCSAYELALISSYAMKNPEFRKIASTKIYNDMPYAGREYNRIITNKNRLLNSYEGASGIKTGFTKKAGRCLVASSTQGGMEVVAVVLNCGPMFEECARLMNKAFAEYKFVSLSDVGQKIGEAKLKDGENIIELYGRATVQYPLTASELSRLETKIKILDSTQLDENQTELPIAEFVYYLDSVEIGRAIGYSYEILLAEEIAEITGQIS
ncbi:MAG: D-alanyl-D-alanine carboxypeptidase [Firmicutes bacterium]|nr:D-alanyl-D-alanine carboxypeptidase [Bacillota bacterium]